MLQSTPERFTGKKTTGGNGILSFKGRLILGLLLMIACQWPLQTMAQNITLKGNKLTLQQIFTEVKKQTNFAVVFNPEAVDVKIKVNVAASNLPLETFMKNILAGLPYVHNVIGSNIVVYKKEEQLSVLPDAGSGRNLSGFIFDEKSALPLRGVSVTINGSGIATQTNEQGQFIFKNVPDQFTLTVTSIGYEKVLRKVLKEDKDIMVPMAVATSELDQAVVQAYGSTTKRMATGNITKVTAEEIRRQPVMNPLMSLQGKVPGLIVTPVGAASSGTMKVEIRGRNSFNPNVLSEPLYVIDGVPQTVLEVNGALRFSLGVSSGVSQGNYFSATKGQSPLFSLNPRDIESIEVLKDGDATAIYGSRAANGVILITTRKAKPGKTTVDFSIRQGVTMVPKNRSMLSTEEYLDMRREALRNDGVIPDANNAPDLTVWDPNRYTNWYKEILGTGKTTTLNAGISGGDAKTSFRLNAEYTNQVDLYSRDGHNKRAALSYNMNHRSVNQRFTASFSANYSYTDVNAVMDNPSSFTLPPNAPPIFDEKGNLNYAAWNEINQPNSYPFDYILKPNIVKTHSLTSSLKLDYELMKGLNIAISAGYTNMQNKNDFYTPIAAQNPLFNPTGQVALATTANSNWIIEPQLRYSTFIGKGNLTAQAGASLQTVTTTATGLLGMGFTDDDLLKNLMNAPFGGIMPMIDGKSMYKYAAIFGRISYDWDRKYILTLNGRRDGSSRFAIGKQFGNFGSVGAAWLASEEEWMDKLLPEWFSFLKFRGSYAITGNDGVKDYEFYPQWASMPPSGYGSLFDYNGTKPFNPVVPVNQRFQWESVKKLEAAIQLGFLQDKINVEFAWYRNRSGNQLTNIPMPSMVGFAGVTGNWDAVVDNSGIEASLTAALIRKKDLSLSFSFNIGRNQNKLVKYPGLESSTYSSEYKIGQSLSTRYFYHYLGVNPLTGTYVFEDYNKDGKVSMNGSVPPGTLDDDRYISIDMNPAFSGGFGTNLNYKNVGLALGFSYTKTKGDHPFASMVPGGMRNLILPKELINNHWKKPGDNVAYGRYTTSATNVFLGSDRAVIDASYLRLNNIALSYQLPDKLIKQAGMQSCQFSINAQNIFTITSYQADPEIQGASFVPIPRLITASLSFNF